MNHDKESFYQVEFKILHKKLEVCAFLDTGNFLYEPVSQMPVCILEEETFLKYFHEPLFKMIEKQEAEILQLGAGFGTVEAEHWEVTEQGIHVEGTVWVSILYLTR